MKDSEKIQEALDLEQGKLEKANNQLKKLKEHIKLISEQIEYLRFEKVMCEKLEIKKAKEDREAENAAYVDACMPERTTK
jgi:hypothetical protein